MVAEGAPTMTRRSLACLCTGVLAFAVLLVAPAYGEEPAIDKVLYPFDNAGPEWTWVLADFFGLYLPLVYLVACAVRWRSDRAAAKTVAIVVLVVHGLFQLFLIPHQIERFRGRVTVGTVIQSQHDERWVHGRRRDRGYIESWNQLVVHCVAKGGVFDTYEAVDVDIHVGEHMPIYYVPGWGAGWAMAGDRPTLSWPVARGAFALLVGMLEALFAFAFLLSPPWEDATRPRRPERKHQLTLGSTGYENLSSLVEAVKLELGFSSTGTTFMETRFQGAVGPDVRRACIDFYGARENPGEPTRTFARFTVSGQNLPSARIVEGERSPLVLPRTPQAAREAFQRGGARARWLVEEILEQTACLELERDRVVATVPIARLELDRYRSLIERMSELAGCLERRLVTLQRLGISVLALPGVSAAARCAYCHADVTGQEPDLVSCAGCRTVLHEACWKDCIDDAGRCPLLGCESTSVARGST
jgi:hypothetical protein